MSGMIFTFYPFIKRIKTKCLPAIQFCYLCSCGQEKNLYLYDVEHYPLLLLLSHLIATVSTPFIWRKVVPNPYVLKPTKNNNNFPLSLLNLNNNIIKYLFYYFEGGLSKKNHIFVLFGAARPNIG